MRNDRFFHVVFLVLLLAVISAFGSGVAAEGPPLSAEKMQTGEGIPFTLSDRDRLIRLEEGQKSLQRQIDEIKDDTRRQFDDIRNLIYLVFGTLLTGMFTLIGFILWDRRTTLAPVVRKNLELEERGERLVWALKAYAEVEPRMAEVLRSLRLMK